MQTDMVLGVRLQPILITPIGHKAAFFGDLERGTVLQASLGDAGQYIDVGN